MSGFFNRDGSTVTRFSGHFEEWLGESIVSMFNSHPTFNCTSHILESSIQSSTRGFNLGQSIQSRNGQIGRTGIGKFGETDHGCKVFFGENNVFSRSSDSVNGINLLDFHFVRSNVHNTLRLVFVVFGVAQVAGCPTGEGFDVEALQATSTLDKSTETNKRCHLVSLVSSIELQNGVLLGLHTKGRNTLSTIDIERPNRLSVVSGNTWKETRKGRFGVEIFHDKAANIIEKTKFASRSNGDLSSLGNRLC
mmetsp:Transcript_22760/g.35125  ORF Transcript_22760/g.35125 Transcript_22760/m.35125 type:complete len:250 (+) Transcript_22760:1371-2120(+)